MADQTSSAKDDAASEGGGKMTPADELNRRVEQVSSAVKAWLAYLKGEGRK